MLLLLVPAAGEDISGIISEDQQWYSLTSTTKEYHITGNTLIEPGVTVEIGPGVQVIFDDSYYILVEGTLRAVGEADRKVGFELNTDSKNAYFSFIRIDESSVGSLFEDCHFQANADYGYYYYVLTSAGELTISNSEFHSINSNPQVVIEPENKKVNLSNNSFNKIEVLIVGNPSVSSVFSGNDLSIGGAKIDANTLIISKNIFNTANIDDTDQPITQNIFNTLDLEDHESDFSYNTIHELISIESHETGFSGFKNNILGNLHTTTRGPDLDIPNNYWGTTDTSEIDERITDYYDDFDLAKVTYQPILTSEVDIGVTTATTTSTTTSTTSTSTSTTSTSTTTTSTNHQSTSTTTSQLSSTTSTTLPEPVPHLINVNGRLSDSSGNPFSGSVDMVFRIYSQESGGDSHWIESHTGSNVVEVTDGYFDSNLGGINPLTLTFSQPLWLGITVESDSEMTPRTRLVSSPYAIRSQYANSIDPQCPQDMLDMGGYCIDEEANPEDDYWTHVLRCDIEGKRMCEYWEWYLACKKNQDLADIVGYEMFIGGNSWNSDSSCEYHGRSTQKYGYKARCCK